MKFMCHFLWQAQHLVKCGMIAGPGNVVIFNRICFWRARKVTSAARRVAVCVFMVGSWSGRSRIGNDTSAVSANLSQILEGHFSWQAQYLVTHCK